MYCDAHYLVAEVELDPAAAARRSHGRCGLHAGAQFTGYFLHNSFGSVYREAGVFADVVHRGTRAITRRGCRSMTTSR